MAASLVQPALPQGSNTRHAPARTPRGPVRPRQPPYRSRPESRLLDMIVACSSARRAATPLPVRAAGTCSRAGARSPDLRPTCSAIAPQRMHVRLIGWHPPGRWVAALEHHVAAGSSTLSHLPTGTISATRGAAAPGFPCLLIFVSPNVVEMFQYIILKHFIRALVWLRLRSTACSYRPIARTGSSQI